MNWQVYGGGCLRLDTRVFLLGKLYFFGFLCYSGDMSRIPPIKDRFWKNVDKSGEHWLWTGRIDHNGYGKFRLPGTKTYRPETTAQRFAYETEVGPIPESFTVDHLCRVRSCVRPDHLEAVSNRENTLRGIGPSAVNAKKTECIRGHAFDEDNTGRNRQGRFCRECNRVRNREARRKRKLAV